MSLAEGRYIGFGGLRNVCHNVRGLVAVESMIEYLLAS